MKRLLVGSIPMPQNRFLVDLNAALSRRMEVTHDADAFWDRRGDFDAVHLHFPEYTTFKHQDAYKNGLDETLVEQTEARLKYWSERCPIVITRHVLLPHDAVRDPKWERFYELFYRYADGVVHFADASVKEFKNRYRDTAFASGPPEHAIIPHHNYASLPNDVPRDEARRRLGIGQHRRVMLVFGAIRNDAERELIESAFSGAKVANKLLLVPRWRETLADVSWIRLKYWLRDARRAYHRLHPRHHFGYDFVEEADTQLYLNAADILFIPRFHVLNSGNVTLGMTFGKVVVGPDSWDVGELLGQTGNVCFDPDRPQSAGRAVERAFELSDQNVIGAANRERALSEWSAETCGEQYAAFFMALRHRNLTASSG